MLNNLKMIMYRIAREYHHRMVTYYDHKSEEYRNKGYSGFYYEDCAWKHLSKELELNSKLAKRSDSA